MRWFSILNNSAFKDWLIAIGSASIRQGDFRLDPFVSSLRKFNNAHTALSQFNQNNANVVTGQMKTDVTSAGLMKSGEASFTMLGKKTINEWDNFGIPSGDLNYEIHRCLILANNALSLGNSKYISYYENWLTLRELFEYDFLITNELYLYFFSYFDKDHNDFNPVSLIKKLKLNQTYFDPTIDWNQIKTFYNDPNVDTSIDSHDSTINGYVTREGRSNLCIAYELLSMTDNNDRLNLINSLGLTGAVLDKLIEINESIKPYTKAFNKIYYGPPGTGKSFEVNKITNIHKVKDAKRVEKVTFHPEYDYHSFVGSYKPSMDGDRISYKFVPQAFAKVYVNAWKDLSNEYFIQIEEINRGNCAEIFGDLFQLLDRNSDYELTADEDLKRYLQDELGENHKGIKNGKINLPSNLNIIATMNTSDQSLFPMDSAFKRRWDWVFTPIKYEIDCDDISKDYIIRIDDKEYKWLSFLEKVNKEIFNATESQDKQIGNWFITPNIGNIIDSDTFVGKVIFYLWNDIFKEEDEHNIFKVDDIKANEFDINTDKKIVTFEKFYENGNNHRIAILKYLFDDVLGVEEIS